MKVISVTLLSLLVACSSVESFGQSADSQKPLASSPQPRKSQESLSQNTLRSAPKSSPERPEPGAVPGDPTTAAQKHYDSALAFSEAGRLDEAIAAFKQSLKLKPEAAQTHFSLGMTYSKSKAYKEALDSFKKAVRYRPEWAEAHFRLGVMSYVLGKKDLSNDEYKKLLQTNSPLAAVLYRIIKDDSFLPDVLQSVSASDPLAVAPRSELEASSNQSTELQGNSTERPANTTATTTVEPIVTAPTTLTEIYKVGVGDILDVRFLNSVSTGRSTLFTVVGGGVIDLPVAGGPISVAGLTTDEIQTRVVNELKRRAISDSAQISVGVRQYGSHSVQVNGLVASPGTRFLRREAVPLFVVLSESQLRNDAGHVVIMRGGSQGQTLDVSNTTALNMLVLPGDVITVTGRAQEFYFIAGKINYPGQKYFQPGITLLQAILAAGGVRQNESIVEISRDGEAGRLVTTRYNLKQIKSGEVGDPKVQPGDRIEVLK